MIEDPELKALFQAESEERIEHLKEGLNELRVMFAPEIIEGVFRDAHTIKGSARMLGLSDIEKLAHQIEEILDPYRKGQTDIAQPQLDQVFQILSVIESLVFDQDQEKPKKPEPITPKEAPQQVKIEAPKPSIAKVETKSEESKEESASAKEQLEPIAMQALKTFNKAASSPSSQGQTIRVTKKQLNELMTQAGELTVIKNKATTVIDQTEEVLNFLQKSIRTASLYKMLTTNREQAVNDLADVLREVERHLSKMRDSSYEDMYKLNGVTNSLVSKIRRLSLVPLNKLFDLFPKMVEDLARYLGKEVTFQIEGGEITVDKKIIEEMKDPIMHILRNSVSHGLESPSEREKAGKPKVGKLKLAAQQISHTILIEIVDDGRGLDNNRIKQKALEKKLVTQEEVDTLSEQRIINFIFLPGFSTASTVTNISGRGVGLDVVKSTVEAMQGNLSVESKFGSECKFIIEIPTTVLTAHVFLVRVYKGIFAIPVEAIESIKLISINEVFKIDQLDVFLFEGSPVTITTLAEILKLQSETLEEQKSDIIHCVVLNIQGKRLAMIVDEIIDEQHIVLVPFKHGNDNSLISGSTILKTGKVCVVIDPLTLIRQIIPSDSDVLLGMKSRTSSIVAKKKILLVDDSYAFRIYCKKILEEGGYEVQTAEDGMEAYQKLKENIFDLIVTDVEMPNMDGLTLTQKIRQEMKNFLIPIVVMSTRDSNEDTKKGIEAGANVYITKSSFYQKQLLDTLKTLLI